MMLLDAVYYAQERAAIAIASLECTHALSM